MKLIIYINNLVCKFVSEYFLTHTNKENQRAENGPDYNIII